MKVFGFDGLEMSTYVVKIAAKLALDFKLEKEVSFTVSNFGVSVFLNAYNDGPLNDTFYSLAMAIENEAIESLHR